MKFAIVDDERLWQVLIECELEKYPWKEKIEIDYFSSGEEFNYEQEYDLVFLDVEMKEMDGFETARRYKRNYENAVIIFLTTHAELCSRGYMVNAFRYIDKEKMAEELEEALNSFENLQRRESRFTFHILHKGDLEIPLKDILYIETELRKVVIHTKTQTYFTNQRLDDLEKELEGLGFFRCHKSYLVSLQNIYDFDKKDVYYGNGKKAMISGRKYAELKQRYLEEHYMTANS